MQIIRYSCHTLIKPPIFIKLHKNLSSGSRLSHADGQTDKTKLVVAFRNFAKAIKTYNFFYCFVKT
jgi:hypothetical protein